MTKLWKLTDQDGYTRRYQSGETLWYPGKRLLASGEGNLCGPGFVHAYTDPLLAVLLNPIHAKLKDPRLWRCEGRVAKEDRGLKVGCVSLVMLFEVPLPNITIEQRVRFGILCALEVFSGAGDWLTWAERWLAGLDRSGMAAQAARATAEATEATEATAVAAAEAAEAASAASYSAAVWEAESAAAWAESAAAWAAMWAAESAAAWAASAAARASYSAALSFDLIALARKSIA